jgi:hypothetical protein
MTTLKRLLLIVGIFTALPAYGYIDPGTGALVIQAVISAVVGGLFLARSALAKIARRVQRLFKPDQPDATQSEPPA